MSTVYEARKQFIRDLPDGCICPVCDRQAKVYKYSISRNHARLLEAMSKDPREWFGLKDLPTPAPAANEVRGKFVTQYSLLKHWGLLEAQGKGTGIWRITQDGRDFVNGAITVSHRIRVALDQCVGLSDQQVTFQEALAFGKGRPRRKYTYLIRDLVLPPIDTFITVEEARQQHAEAIWKRGTRCILCDRMNKVYHSPLNHEMARVLGKLAEFHRETPSRYIHVYDQIPNVRGGWYSRLAYWGFIEGSNEEGCWRITGEGLDFVEGRSMALSHVWTLNDTFIRLDGSLVSYNDALGVKFDLQAV